jgi:hypothetical protein
MPDGDCTQMGVSSVTIRGRHIYIREESCVRLYREVALFVYKSCVLHGAVWLLKRTINWTLKIKERHANRPY